jgi:hypothetical protein
MIPAVLVFDEAMTSTVVAGIERAAGTQTRVHVHPGDVDSDGTSADVLVVIVVPSTGPDDVAHDLLSRGARPFPVLTLATDTGVLPASIARLAGLPEGLNVPVPTIDDEHQRELVWRSLREADVHERLHLVEVDGRPALDELAARGTIVPGDPLARLAAGAAGVLAGRMAAGNRRWRDQLA